MIAENIFPIFVIKYWYMLMDVLSLYPFHLRYFYYLLIYLIFWFIWNVFTPIYLPVLACQQQSDKVFL